MEEQSVKTLDLDNGYKLEILDASRRIAEDTFLVTMVARLKVRVCESLFTQAVDMDDMIAVLGEERTFEYRLEQNFIRDNEKDEMFGRMLDTFVGNTLPYLSKPGFPEKFIMKEYREKAKK